MTQTLTQRWTLTRTSSFSRKLCEGCMPHPKMSLHGSDLDDDSSLTNRRCVAHIVQWFHLEESRA